MGLWWGNMILETRRLLRAEHGESSQARPGIGIRDGGHGMFAPSVLDVPGK